MRTRIGRAAPIPCMFVDIGGVLLSNGWDHLARKRAAQYFKLAWAEMDRRHRLNFEIHEEGRLGFKDYLSRVVFHEKRPFSRAQSRSFMCAQSKACPEMISLVSELEGRYGLKPDVEIFRLALDVAQSPQQHIVYIENAPLFVEIAEGLGIRSILHTDYKTTCAKLALPGIARDA